RNAGTEYNIYKIIDVDSTTADHSLVTYKVADKWAGFFKTSAALNYVSIDQNGAVTAKSTFTQTTAPEFAALAMAYAKANGITSDGTKTANGTDDVVFDQIPLGYYLVDTSIGALCGLTTTQPTASVSVKNHVPTIAKKVQEDSDATSGTSSWGETNTADIGQVVNFDVTIDAQQGAQNYVYHDKMDDGLTLKIDDETPLEVKFHQNGAAGSVTWKEGVEYTVSTTCTDGCTFEVVIDDEAVKNVKGEDKIYILYSAVLNTNATSAGENNICWLSFGDKHKTEDDKTTTYCYGYEIVKTDASNAMLDGAEFQMYASTDPSAQPIKLYKNADNSYRKATDAEITAGTNIVTDIEVKLVGGKAVARIDGFDNDVYYIKETKNPAGYNAMVGFKTVTISNGNVYAEFDSNNYKAGTGVQVINQKGAVLPTTGGMGTMLFVTFGAIAVIGAGVLLVTKKRMSMIED
ncbi:MAG: LPXTG cell wall anchor domain-containing protein, partial [Oscillospiraceae bacterium]|nr:LPXTG cell wall anchor domain-containing protein [Oscillospiraceae bacterium]